MPSTYSTSLKLELIQNGEQSGLWGQSTNNNLRLIEQAISGVSDIVLVSDNYTLSTFNGLPDESRSAVLSFSGALASPANVIAPSVQKTYIVTNNTGANVTVKTSSGNGVTVLNTTSSLVYCDGTNFYEAVSLNNVIGNQTITGNEVINANLTASGNVTVTNSVSTYLSRLYITSNTSIVTAANNTGAYIPPTGTTAQRPTSPNGGMSRFNTDTGTYEIFNGAVWQSITGAYSVNYLFVAGGGAGGGAGGFGNAGGGGGGGCLANVSSVQPGTSYSIVVGAGGATFAAQGANTTGFSLTAVGGGGGGNNAGNGGNGGSGGGAARSNDGFGDTGGSGVSGQGFPGGNTNGTDTSSYGAAGGGGAGAAGQDGQAFSGGSGGVGLQTAITGANAYYAGGGGGAGGNSGGPGGAGGGGSGGAVISGTPNGNPGTANTGGGGGGGSVNAAQTNFGGSGIAIIAYPSATQRATGGNVTTYTTGGVLYWVHTFTTSGTFVA